MSSATSTTSRRWRRTCGGNAAPRDRGDSRDYRESCSSISCVSRDYRGFAAIPKTLLEALVLQVGADQLAELFQPGERGVPAVGRDVPDQPVDAGPGAALDLLGGGLWVVGDGYPLAARIFRQALELGNPLEDIPSVGHPAVGVAD